MPEPVDTPGIPRTYRNFLALPPEQSALDSAGVVLIPVPYDSTTSFRSGARYGPESIISASCALEDYDPELELDVSSLGVHTAEALEPHMGGPGPMVDRVREAAVHYLAAAPGRTVGLLGGEHSLTAGAVQAFADVYPRLSVLYLDAHADMRAEYQGTPWSHASAARRVYERCPVSLAGVRSLSYEEHEFIRANGVPVWFQGEVQDAGSSLDDVLDGLSSQVYVSVDLDVMDPSLMPAVGTPEPGGLDWTRLVSILRRVGESRQIVGFDVCELSPGEGPAACSYTAAKLVYKLAQYSCALPRRR